MQSRSEAETLHRCPACGVGRLHPKVVTERFPYDDDGAEVMVVAENVPVETCDNPKCAEEFSGPVAAAIRHEAICRALRLLTPSEIRSIRERLDLTQEQFTKLTRIGQATICRWERGRLLQNPAMDRYLRLIAASEDNVRFLQGQGQNGTPGTPAAPNPEGETHRAAALAAYIRGLPAFEIVTSIDGNYAHMGATLVDAVLQAGVKYETVVRPRVRRLIDDYPQARTTSGFAQLLKNPGPKQLLSWSGERKLRALADLTTLLLREQVESEDDFRAWVSKPNNVDRLRSIKGIKKKTADYIHILLGRQSVAVDRHLLNFLKMAGLEAHSYEEAHRLIHEAAGLLGVQPSILDHSIWRYMSSGVRSKA